MEEIVKVFGLNWKLLIIQAVNFGVLLLVLGYFLYRPIVRIVDRRRAAIEEGVRDAEKARERVREVEEERAEILKRATHSAEETLATAKQRAQEEAAHIVEDADARAESIVSDAQRRAEEARERAMRESREEIGKAAILAAEKILREKRS